MRAVAAGRAGTGGLLPSILGFSQQTCAPSVKDKLARIESLKMMDDLRRNAARAHIRLGVHDAGLWTTTVESSTRLDDVRARDDFFLWSPVISAIPGRRPVLRSPGHACERAGDFLRLASTIVGR